MILQTLLILGLVYKNNEPIEKHPLGRLTVVFGCWVQFQHANQPFDGEAVLASRWMVRWLRLRWMCAEGAALTPLEEERMG